MAHGVGFLGQGASTWRRGTTIGVHVAAAAVGGLMTAAAVWIVLTPVRTLLPDSAVVAVLVAAMLCAALIDLGILQWQLPGHQVPQTWLARHGALRAYAMYGALLGSGLATYVNYAVVLGVFAIVGCTLSLSAAVATGALFGAARAGTVALASFDLRADTLLFRGRWASQAWHGAAATLCLVLAVAVVVT